MLRLVRAASLLALVLGALAFASGVAGAASYQQIDGTIVDPIQSNPFTTSGGPHPYAGINLEPGANLNGISLDHPVLNDADLDDANISDASLFNALLHGASLHNLIAIDANLESISMPNGSATNADFSGANMISASLTGTDLTGSNFTSANLTLAGLVFADLTDAILISANLTSIDHLDSQNAFSTTTWTGARYSLNAKDNSGNSIPDTIFPTGFDPVFHGMVLIPEPTTALLLTLGLAGLGMRRRASA